LYLGFTFNRFYPTFVLLEANQVFFLGFGEPMLQISTIYLGFMVLKVVFPVTSIPSYAAGRYKPPVVLKGHLGQESVNAEVSSFNTARDQFGVLHLLLTASGKFSSRKYKVTNT